MNANASNFDPTGGRGQQQQQQQQGLMYAPQQQQEQYSGGGAGGGYGSYYPEESYGGAYGAAGGGAPQQASMGYPGVDTYEYGAASAADPQQQQQQYYTSTGESAAYYRDATGYGGDPGAYAGDYTTAAVEPGSFYPHPESPVLLPQVHGAPVTALAQDSSFAALYVGSATSGASAGHPHHHHRHHRDPHHQGATAALAVHSTLDGSLYAAVAGHPETPTTTRDYLYATMFGGSSSINVQQRRQHIPNHAYRPPFGAATTNSDLPPRAAAAVCHVGIQSLVPLQGYVGSVSPAAVRVHAMGGLQMADWDVTGMLAGTAHPAAGGRDAVTTHMTVGGACGGGAASSSSSDKNLYCVDLYQGLRVVSSAALDSSSTTAAARAAVTTLASSHSKGSVVAGCSDGFVRLYDGRGLRSLAKVKSHAGGVVDVAVSEDGNLVATTGYGSAGSGKVEPLYGYPDPTVLLYDIRYLGRGGFPHPFAGVRGGPRYLAFLPAVDGVGDSGSSNRLLVASGQTNGGIQIIRPFEEQTGSASDFLLPALERMETISCLSVGQDDTMSEAACLLSLGTSKGRILQYQMAGTLSSLQRQEKQPLVMPSFQPPTPPISLQASLLQKDDTDSGIRRGASENIRAILSTYILAANPTVSAIGDDPRRQDATTASFGPLATNPLVASGRLTVSPDLLAKVDQTVDYLQTVPTAALDLDLFQDHRPKRIQERTGKKYQPQPNPNKAIYSNKVFNQVYCRSLNRRTRLKSSRDSSREKDGDGDNLNIPVRYRLTLRSSHKSAASFSHAEYNNTGYLPGWDYPPTMPNAFVAPVLVLLYFIPEVRALVMSAPFSDRSSTKDKYLVPELGLLFHRIESIASFATLFPANDGPSKATTKIGAWAPSSFISFLFTMPEAEQLQILDGSPEAVATPRRPEAFYRFLLYQLDKEIGKTNSAASKTLDKLSGIAFTSVNEFISGSGPPSKSSTRAMTLDMIYDPFVDPAKFEKGKKPEPSFSDVLQYNLCREKKLRAWNNQSGVYETIVQRKIATSLPTVLSLSCACAGRKEDEGLELWRQMEKGDVVHWLPEIIEVELEEDGLVVVRELVQNARTGEETWKECRGKGSIPSSVSDLIRSVRDSAGPMKRRYRLDAVVSMVRDDLDRNCPEEARREDGQPFGHHTVHVRVPISAKKLLLERQEAQLSKYLSAEHVENVSNMTILGMSADQSALQERLDRTRERLAALSDQESDSEWVLMNGYVVSDSVVEDAQAFHVQFKEPSLVVFRAVDEGDSSTPASSKVASQRPSSRPSQPPALSNDVIRTSSITNGTKSPFASNQKNSTLPGRGDLIAFDAEFVSVQEEDSTLSETGSKLTIRETRHALARISVLNCRDRTIVFDDHVLPREPVVDYLTRFSGIVANDLDPKQSRCHLISSRAAYLKLRCLMERGCIFVGHGLQQDFWMASLAVPSSQVIDTVEIYHQPAQRYISLRFLTNFVLKRDMQQDVHDSVEDALAAYELYLRAVELKKSGEFDKLLNDLYEYGRKTDWKLGMED